MTDALAPASAVKAAAMTALKKASESTGVGFDYLYRVAMRESSLNANARAQTSSAAGLFQFIEATWLSTVKTYGAKHGLAAEAAAIEKDANGKFGVADPARRKEILDLRFDPEKAAALAGELARENKTALEGALGRAVGAAELYAAHFLGPAGAKKLLSAQAGESAASLLPAAAAANRHVFFDGTRARSVGEVIDSFQRTIGVAEQAVKSLGAEIEKSLAPFLRDSAAAMRQAPFERAAFSRDASAPGFEIKGLSPLVLAVLQALDPREIIARDRE